MYQSIFHSDLFKGKVILVTGGGSGLGRCIAHELASLGAKVFLLGRNETKLKNVYDEIVEDGGAVGFRVCDIREEETVKHVVADILQVESRIDGLVNNAGGQFVSPLKSISKKGWDAVTQTNLTGCFLVSREVFVQSMSLHGGSVVNIIADHSNGMPGMGHSGAARAGVENLTRTAALEWAYAGVRVNAVSPGLVATSGLDTYPEGVQKMLPSLKKLIPSGRFGHESEVASAVSFLLSEGSAYITGATLRVDGGKSLTGPMWPLEKPVRMTEYKGFHRSITPKVLSDRGGQEP